MQSTKLPLLFIFCYVISTLGNVHQVSAIGNTTSKPKEETCERAITQCRDGIALPVWATPGNNDGTAWTAAKAFVYLVVMFYFFLGISIISDRFMASIEIITSQEKEITIKDRATGKKQVVTVKIWNETVSNLTLMALGSSAPEILLSVIEIIGRGFTAGELGPSTVVGSAAFNLFMITAVCVSVLPEGEIRRIKHLRVFAFTATCSVFAYVWMYIILSVSSPGQIDVWEGIITLLCFPGMVGVAFAIDVKLNFYRFIRKKIRKQKKHGHTVIQTGDGDVLAVAIKDGDTNKENDKNHANEFDNKDIELLAFKEGDDPEQHMNEKKRIAMEAYHRARAKNPDADSSTLQHLVEQENMKLQHKSRAFYRIQATHRMTGQGNILKLKSNQDDKKNSEEAALQADIREMNENVTKAGVKGTCVYFHPSEYTVVESCGTCYLTVIRVGEDLFNTVYVDYETQEGTAEEGADFEAAKGTLCFAPGENSKTIEIKVVDDDIFELDEYFHCKLTAIRGSPDDPKGSSTTTTLGQPDQATITILDDDYPGVFTLEHEKFEIVETVGVLTLRIVRLIGARGIIRVPYHTEEGSAKGGGEDFEDIVGEIEFTDEETVKTIEIPIVDGEEYEKHKIFSVVLGEPKIVRFEKTHISNLDSVENEEMRKILEAGKPALGEHKRCEVHIVECKEFKNTIDNMLVKANMANFLKSSSWMEQFREAFQVEAGDDDEDDSDGPSEPSYFDYVMHYLCLFWKILFALVPPTDIWGGWGCFVVAILMIGLLTTLTGDIASHFGCTVGLADSVVAISFVALGTSLPDTFASKVATINDETADSSIGNVTGSNSVNVFLGIGLAWSVAAVYHAANGNAFKVDPGALGFSVMVFCVEALLCIGIMMYRRFNPNIGAELGGPRKWRLITSTFCAGLWIIYILLSALQTYCHINADF